MITSIAHNAIKVSDMEKSLDFYCNICGFTKAFEIKDDNNNPWIEYIKICDNTFIELFYGGVKDREKAFEDKVIGYHHMCIITGDIEKLVNRFHEKGVISEAKFNVGGSKNKSVWVYDPDGNAVEFVEYTKNCIYMQECTSTYNYDEKGFTRIGHVGYYVKDMEKSLNYYCDKLGFEKVGEMSDEKGNPKIIFLKVTDGSYIELFYGGIKESGISDNSAAQAHLCLEYNDIYNDVEKLRKNGVVIDSEVSQGKDFNFQAWTHDPDGNKIEIMQIDPKSPQANC